MSDLPGVDADLLVEIIQAALSDADAVVPSSADLLRSALQHAAEGESRTELGMAALAALLYARPDLVPDSLVDQLAELLCTGSPPDHILALGGKLWEFLAASPAAPRAWGRLRQIFQRDHLAPGTRVRLVPVVGAFVQWREDLVDLDAVLTLAASPELSAHRAALLEHGVERFVFCAPERFTPDRLKRLAELFQHLPRYRYVLYALAGRPGVPAASRADLEVQLLGRFPFCRTATAILTQQPIRLLVVVNVGMGQGDDVVRLVPLLQALLDVNPSLTITLVTRRTYLYDHPRVTPVAIGDDEMVHAVLREPFEGVLELFQPEWPHLTLRAELHAALEDMLAAHPPAFLVQGDLGRASKGRAGKRSQFLHQRVELDGRDIAGLCGLDRLDFPSSYDPGHRLLAELGLPQRAAEEQPQASSLLTGRRSADAERVWSELLSPGTGRVALVNPFGGSRATKGFLRQEVLLAAELEGLVSEGYRVVVLPQDVEWARLSAIEPALALLATDVRAHVRVAPDPAGTDVAARLALVERPNLSSADRVMRLFKYFASYADLVVTVEGWLAHLAYVLGRPFRLFLAAGSFTPDWFPSGRSSNQRLVPTLSPHAFRAHTRSGLLGPTDSPPLPHVPRKALLEIALAGLGRAGGRGAVVLLRHAVTSPDADVRRWGVVALGRMDPAGHKADLLAALEDRSPRVLREAADALLRGSVDCSRELGSGYRLLLQAYVDGAAENWEAVARIGPPALPVLFRLAQSDIHDVEWGAKLMLRRMLPPWVPPLREPRLPSAWGALPGGETASP